MDLFDLGEIGSGPLDPDRMARSRSDPLDPDPTAQATRAAGGGTGSPVVGIAAAGLSEFNIFSVPGLGFRRGFAEETAGMTGTYLGARRGVLASRAWHTVAARGQPAPASDFRQKKAKKRERKGW